MAFGFCVRPRILLMCTLGAIGQRLKNLSLCLPHVKHGNKFLTLSFGPAQPWLCVHLGNEQINRRYHSVCVCLRDRYIMSFN